MTIKDVLKSYYAPAGFPFQYIKQLILNKRLAADFANWATTDKTLNWMNKMLTKYNQTEIHPDRVVELCKNMGLFTWESLLKYIEAVNKTNFNGTALFDFQNPKIDVSRFTQKTDQYEIYHILRMHGIVPPIGNDAWPRHKDQGYYFIPDDMVQEILGKFDSDKYKYLLEKRDCDDFSRMVRGQMSRFGIGNALLGVVDAELLYQGQLKYGHSFLIMINESKEIWYADGQDDSYLWRPGEKPPYAGVDAVGKILDMIF